jgi:hypothetical protein
MNRPVNQHKSEEMENKKIEGIISYLTDTKVVEKISMENSENNKLLVFWLTCELPFGRSSPRDLRVC